MKRILMTLLALALLLSSLPALADGAAYDTGVNLPEGIRAYFSASSFDGYTISPNAAVQIDHTAAGSYFFAVAQKDGHNVLHGFRWKDGSWLHTLRTDSAIPQGEGFFQLNHLHGQQYMVFFDSPIFMEDTLAITFIRADYEEQADSAVWFEANKSGAWKVTWALFDYCWSGAQVSDDAVTYYLDEGSTKTTVKGVVERDLRYFSWNAFPKNLNDAKAKLSAPPAIPTGELTAQRIKFVGGQKYEVYSGPGAHYLRGGNGKAAVSTNDWIQVFGRENGYILIQYDITSDHLRFGYIPEAALPKKASVGNLNLEYADAVLTAPTFLTDDPLKSQTPLQFLAAGQNVKWLSTMGDWVYVEIPGTTPERGFVKAASIQKKSAVAVSGSFRNERYAAQAAVTLGSDRIADVRITLTASNGFFQGADGVKNYQIYGNNMLLPAYAADPVRTLLTGGQEQITYGYTVSVPRDVTVLGLCPSYLTGLMASETIIVYLPGDELGTQK